MDSGWENTRSDGELVGMSNDFPLFRYADILMMKAECLLRTGDAMMRRRW
jgi:hypothetical protein